MRLIVTMDCDNAAFEDHGGPSEVGRILVRLGKVIERDCSTLTAGESWPLMDYNGNTVGTAEIVD